MYALKEDIPDLEGYVTQSWIESNYLSLTGGTLTNPNEPVVLSLNSTAVTTALMLQMSGENKAYFGANSMLGAFICDYDSNNCIGVRPDGTPHYNGSNTLIHSGNIGSYASLTDTTYSAGTGLSLSGTTFNHSNSITAVTTAQFKKYKYDSCGHITGTVNVTASDITSALSYTPLSNEGGSINGNLNIAEDITISGTTYINSFDSNYGSTDYMIVNKNLSIGTGANTDNYYLHVGAKPSLFEGSVDFEEVTTHNAGILTYEIDCVDNAEYIGIGKNSEGVRMYNRIEGG